VTQTQLRGTQVLDGSVQRQDLDAVTSGSAVIRKVLPGVGVELVSTGPDAGTGDVTLSVPAITAIVSEAVSSGALCNIFSNSGVLTVQNASASATYSTSPRPANAFCITGQGTVGGSITVYKIGKITGLSSLTAGTDYYLSATTAGSLVTASTASSYTGGQLIQRVGQAISSTVLAFDRGQEFLTA
jgi:hypothetical protein